MTSAPFRMQLVIVTINESPFTVLTAIDGRLQSKSQSGERRFISVSWDCVQFLRASIIDARKARCNRTNSLLEQSDFENVEI